MPVHISEISIDGLHPQPPLHLFPKRVNLIYGRNEFGKTRLVEFLLRSLFHSSGKMNIRPSDTTGRVKVGGLDGNSEIWFYARSRDKLEDHLGVQNLNLPPQLARLLVVKGAESELQAGYPGGLGRAALNEYITNQGLIDRIMDRIPKNTRQAQIQEGLITGNLTGDLKRRKEILDQLVVIDNLFLEIDRQVSGGPLTELQLKMAALEASIDVQRTARQHYVNRLALEQSKLLMQSNVLPTNEILHLESDIREEAYLSDEIIRLEGKRREKEPLLETYEWLEAALQSYQATPLSSDIETKWLLPILAVCSVTGIVVFAFLNIPWMALVFAGIALILGFLTYRQFHDFASVAAARPENKHIAVEYEHRFNSRFHGLSDLHARKISMDRDYNQIQSYSEQIQTAKNRVHVLSSQIEIRLAQWLPGTFPLKSDRQMGLQKLHIQRANLDEALMKVEIELKSSPIKPVDGIAVDEADVFDREKLESLETDIALIKASISDLEQQKLALKQRICDITSSPISTDLGDLILALQEFRAELERAGKTVTAEILAGVAVTQAMQELRNGENATLQVVLQSPVICNTLKAVTGRYNRIDLLEDGLEVSDDYRSFKLVELSTGAQEQVLLGLRIGLASRLFAGQPLFLILDDAFQHSDWQRRSGMVDEVLRLAKAGWQIFYLTMDDHLRDLFLEKTQIDFGDDFLSISLAG